MGFSFRIYDELPPGFLVGASSGAGIDAFFNTKFATDQWRYAAELLSIKATNVAENAAVLPVTFGGDEISLTGRFRRVQLFVQHYIDVLDKEKFDANVLPPVYYLSDDSENHPKAFTIGDVVYPDTSVISEIASYELGPTVIPQLGVRLNAEGMNKLRIFAAFTPVDASEKVMIARQVNVTRANRCDRALYVDGPWPDGLKKLYEYR